MNTRKRKMPNKEMANECSLQKQRNIHSTKPKLAVPSNKESEQLSHLTKHLAIKKCMLSKDSLSESPNNKVKNIPNKFGESKSKVIKTKNINKHIKLTNSLALEDIEKRISNDENVIAGSSRRKALDPKKKKFTESKVIGTNNTKNINSTNSLSFEDIETRIFNDEKVSPDCSRRKTLDPKKKKFTENKVMQTNNTKNINSTNSLTFEDIEKRIFNDEKVSPDCSSRKTLHPKKKKFTECKVIRTNNTKNINSTNSLTFEDIEKKIFKDEKVIPECSSRKAHDAKKKKFTKSTDTKTKKSKSSVTDKNKLMNKSTEKLGKLGIRLTKGKSDSEESDWEEVDELHEILTTGSTEKHSADVQIELKASNLLWGKRKKKFSTREEMIEDYIRKKVNKSIKAVHENMHKVHLLCLFAHGIYLNSIMGREEVIASALSIIPKNYFSPKRLDMNHLEKFLSWFCKHIKLLPTPDLKDVDEDYATLSLDEILQKRFGTRTASSEKELVVMFVVTSRAVGMSVRLIQSLVPMTWKPSTESLIKPKKNTLDSKTISKSTTEENLAPDIIKKKKRKVISSDSDPETEFIQHKEHAKAKNNKKRNTTSEDISIGETKQKKKYFGEWAEVYVEEEEKWISVDVIKKKIHCSSEIEARSSNLAYVVGFNPDQTVKDVTKRYVSNWLSQKNKIQLDGDWWTKSLQNFLGRKDRKDQNEDKELDNNLLQQPLPKTINEYKNHPLYALQRHLLKFEAIYPPDELPVGYIRGEPVFARSSVKTLFGRENWLKEGKTVRVDEEPYKIVKARPKFDRMTLQMVTDRPLELFGFWQVEDYEPPVAKNGKVPRNEYGNVDLFKPSMLPRGCVHLPVNGLYRIARKLNIDCVPAVVGFEFRSWGSHPVHDGFVVCEEFKDILMDAWNQEQFERAKKETEKRINRVYGNWKKLIQKIILKDRLKEKYGLLSKAEKVDEKKKGKRKIEQKDLDLASHTIITHKVPQISINTSSQIIDSMSKRQKKKTKINSKDSIHHSDEEEFSVTEKQEKIRNILKWNPKTVGSEDSDPPLSDESDAEGSSASLNHTTQVNNGRPRKEKSPIPTTESKREFKSKSPIPTTQSKRKIKTKLVKSRKDFETSSKEVGDRRRSQRIKSSNQVKYDEGDQSDSDISLCESDVSDKNYNPVSNIDNGSILDLSEDSE